MKSTLVFDVETHEAGQLYTMQPAEFVRLIGYRWSGQDTVLTTDLEELREQIRAAKFIVGHNIHSFDLPAVFGHKSNEPLELAMEGRVYDTWTHAVLVNPCPSEYVNREGKTMKEPPSNKVGWMKKWFRLDEQAHQLGVPGKTDDLKALAFEFGDPERPKKDRVKDGYGKIPIDDPRYRAYLLGDVDASEAVGKELLKLGPLDAYAMREQEIESRKAVISSNGIRVNTPKAQARADELAARREVIMSRLVADYDFPTAGAQPWRSNDGKEAILAALEDAGATAKTRPDWPRTANGALSLGGETLKNLTAGTDAEDLGTALAELMGQRSLAQLALDSVHADGFAHPQISMLQRSGRWSTTEPGLTIWTARGPGAVEKAYFVPDGPEDVLLELDYSNADARVVAALSGDTRYAERFEPSADGHLINAWAAWGKDKVGTDKHDPTTAHYRQLAKPGGHGWGYRIGARKLAGTWGLPVSEAKTFLDKMSATFRKVVAWQDRSVAYAARHGYVTNPWGRRMPVERGREYTQAPALEGQSGTREIACDAILRMPIPVLRRTKAFIHDALLFSVPAARWEACRDDLIRLMQTEFDPPGGQKIAFPVSSGPPGADWYEASHE